MKKQTSFMLLFAGLAIANMVNGDAGTLYNTTDDYARMWVENFGTVMMLPHTSCTYESHGSAGKASVNMFRLDQQSGTLEHLQGEKVNPENLKIWSGRIVATYDTDPHMNGIVLTTGVPDDVYARILQGTITKSGAQCKKME